MGSAPIDCLHPHLDSIRLKSVKTVKSNSEQKVLFITITMGMNSSRLMMVTTILAALTSSEVEACLGEPCKIGNPTMCRLIRETNRAGSMPSHSHLGEPMTPMRRRLSNEDADERKARRGR